MKVENLLSASELMDVFTSRKNQYSNAISELEIQLTRIRTAAVKENDFPLVFAGIVLSSACKSDKEKAKDFACALISHVRDGKPTSSFLESNPDYADLDLTWFVEENPKLKKILAPIKKQNLFGLLNGTGLIEELDDKKHRGGGRLLKKDAEVKIDNQSNLTTIEDVKSLYPNIRRLFDEGSGAWVFVNGIELMSSKTLYSLFEKNNPSGDEKKDNLAISQSLLGEWGQLNKFFRKSPNHSRDEVTKLGGSNMLYFPKELVTDFLVFVAEKLSSRNVIEIKIKDGGDTQLFNSRKNPVETQKEITPPLSTKNFSEDAEDPKPDDPSAVKIDSKTSFDPDPVPEISKGKGVIVWDRECLMKFFASREGIEAGKKAKDKFQISSKYFNLTKNYPAINTLLDSKTLGFYWRSEHRSKGGTLRTSLTNLTKLLRFGSGLGRYLTTEEQSNFLANNIDPLWEYLFFTNIGGKVDGEEGVFLTKEEYVNAAFLLEEALNQKELNPMGIALSKDSLFKALVLNAKNRE